MKRLSAALALMSLAAPAALAGPTVVADIAPVHGLVARVMQGVGAPTLLVPPGADEHGYALRPSEAAALEAATLVVWVGEGLTPWLAGPIATLAGDARVVEWLDLPGARLLPIREGGTWEAHDHDHAEGADAEAHDHDHAEAKGAEAHDHDHAEAKEAEAHDHDHDHAEAKGAKAHDHDHDHAEAKGAEAHDHDHDHAEAKEAEAHDHDHDHDHAATKAAEAHDHAHGAADPHLWLDPGNARALLAAVAAALAEADPANAAAYAANAAAGAAEIDRAAAEARAALAAVKGRGYIVFHDAYQYFETAFDMPAAGSIALNDATAPSARRLAEIREKARALGAACVFAEPQHSARLVDTVVEGTTARTGVLDPLGADIAPGPDFWPALVRGLAADLAGCLG
jgi:zinc transport system substrate-binding protein